MAYSDSAGDGATPLGNAAFDGHQEVVELLVEVGNAQLNKQDDDGRTVLHWAACNGRLETVKYLVARGCSLTVQCNAGRTALDRATHFNRPQFAQFLSSASDLITTNNYRGKRSLCAPFSSPFLERKIAISLRYTTMLCLKTIEKRGDAFSSCNLFSRIFQHEAGLIRHILSNE
jgi:ankyrin repeat protein